MDFHHQRILATSAIKDWRDRMRYTASVSSLGLGVVLLPINGDPSSSSSPLQSPSLSHPHFSNRRPKPPGLKGGSEPPIPPPFLSLSSLSLQTIRESLLNHFNSSPLTTLQILTGSTLFLFNLTGLIPLRSLLFHTRLALAPRWELYRIPTSFLILGTNLIDVVRSCAGMVYWQSPLEKSICGNGDLIKDGRLVQRGENRKKSDGKRQRKTDLEWLVTQNRFLRIQMAAVATLTILEIALYRDPKPISTPWGGAGGILVFPYTLFPLLEHTMRWLWAFTDLHSTTTLFGFLPVQPIYAPLVLCGMSGFSTWKSMLKGFVGAAVVAKGMKLRRGGEGGEEVGEFLYYWGRGWYNWMKALVVRAETGKMPPSTSMPGSFPGEGRTSGGQQVPASVGVSPDVSVLMAQFTPYVTSLANNLRDLATPPPSPPSSGVGSSSSGYRGPVIEEL
ncbi:hypothetical protein HDV05_000349 [Chytridiales sp. JEL 0842]|nr:hypothetical protein HDV05_000349 [Chytridiales sp. JEL 0842]